MVEICISQQSSHDESVVPPLMVQRNYQKKVGWDKHARPIPIKGRPSKSKKKKKRGQIAICECTETYKKKNFARHFGLSHGELGRGEDFSKFFFLIPTKPKP